MDKKIILFALILLAIQPALVSAYVSLSVSGTSVPSTVAPGSKINLIMTLTNLGTTNAESVKLNLKSNTYMTPDQYQYDLQTIQAGSSISVTVPLAISESIPEGTNALFFSIDYSESGTSGTKTFENSVTVSVTKRSLIEVSSVFYSESFIQPGDTVTMNMVLQNLGKGTVKDLTVSLNNISSIFVPVGTGTDTYLGSLDPSQTGMATFNVIVNKNVDTLAYSVPITITYYDASNMLHTDLKYVGIQISGKPEFVVSIEKEDNFFLGSTGTLSISISNRGTATAQYLTAKFDSNLYVTPSEYYVGNLNPDDSSTIPLSVDLKGLEAGKHSLNMTLFYKDPYNKDYSESRLLQFDVVSKPIQIFGNTEILIVLAVLVILYWKRKPILGLIKRK